MEGPIRIRVTMAEGMPQGLKPASVAGFVAKAEASACLEAKRDAFLLTTPAVAKAEALACLEAKTDAFLLTTPAANV